MAAGKWALPCELHLPHLPLAACSSSLVGVHMAYNGLQLRQCASAAASGVNLLLHPETSAIAQKAGMLAPDGRCKALSAAADGYGRAEACGVLLLQQAAAVGTGALALLAGSAVNQDGRSSSLTAPNGPSQQEVIRAATAGAGMAPAAVSGLSMHGTGEAAVSTLLCALPCQLNACMHMSGQNAHP